MRSILFALCLAVSATACGDGGGSGAPRADRIGKHHPPGPAVPIDLRLLVDQFGYRPLDRKVAVIRSAEVGFDAGPRFTPAADYEVRSAADGSVALSAAIQPWNGGAVQASSGDLGWWFDFSALEKPGTYYVFDTRHQRRSATFRISQDVYRRPLLAAMRALYYQRSGFEKKPPHAEACWADKAAYLGPQQDREARDIRDPDNKTTARDLSGGWFDAGDTNKYVTFATQPVHQLLMAYQRYPAAFGDDFKIPESGNGIPDVIDELKWQIDWLKRMQNADGSAALKVGARKLAVGVPSADRLPRFYVARCTSSTITAAGMFAHAALVYKGIPQLAAESAELALRAARAFEAYQLAGKPQTECDDGSVLAGDADLPADTQQGFAAQAALYLFALTGQGRYHDYLKGNVRSMFPYKDVGWTRYHPSMGEALLFYTTLPSADPEFSQTLRADKRADMDSGHGIYRESADDLYRNFLHSAQYHWGSNNVRASYGGSNLDVLSYRLDEPRAGSYAARALDTLHYFHGVNPFGQVYLTNMYAYGATHSMNEAYHVWFFEGTRWSSAVRSECGPAPGFVTGGPNANATNEGVPATLVPPAGQPPQKAYRDWNSATSGAWVASEPSNTYQGAYIKLLAGFQP